MSTEPDNRSPERRAQDDRIAAEPPLPLAELPPDAPCGSVEEIYCDKCGVVTQSIVIRRVCHTCDSGMERITPLPRVKDV